jgi:serine/threonine protein kinase HipA of HipAB toxin-antitoxin module
MRRPSVNQDDHTKNAAFLMDGQGKWRVAPAYDLTFHRNSSGSELDLATEKIKAKLH